jgi:3',5'-cyclic AMP phosphodiesterase CpdA
MFVLAHLSDPHLALPRPALRELASKRAIGFFNWYRKRRHVHRGDVLAGLVADILAHKPDHIACTGDLVNIAARGEFEPALDFLRALGPPNTVTLTPGNHDAYVAKGTHWSETHWGDYMQGDHRAEGAPRFPFVRRRGPLAVVGVSSAVPTRPFRATGLVGPSQLAGLGHLLRGLRDEGRFRVVLIHHPPQSPRSQRMKWLVDAEAFRDTLRREGAELVIHGHDHVHSLVWIAGPERSIPTVGVPSASALPRGRHPGAGYNLYRISGEPGAWSCEAVARGTRDGIWVDLARQELTARD